MVERKWGYANATRRRSRALCFVLADDPGTGKTIQPEGDLDNRFITGGVAPISETPLPGNARSARGACPESIGRF